MATKSLSKLKAEMTFNSDLTRLVDVMKGVAIAQYYVMDRKKVKYGVLNESLEEIFTAYDFRYVKHPFIRVMKPKKLVVLVTTDSGFLGGLNMKVAQGTLKYDSPDSHYLVIGERGMQYLKEFGKSCQLYPGISQDDTRFALADKLTGDILKFVLKGEYGQVIIGTPHAISFSAQRVEVLNLLPCPLFFKGKPEKVPTAEDQEKNYILDSKVEGFVEYLTAIWLRKRLLEIFDSAKLAEFGARVMHLEGSFQTLTKNDKQLKLQFFKARREKIDQSLRESFTSQLLIE